MNKTPPSRFAHNTNYASGAQSGTPTKIEPATGVVADGIIPGVPFGAQNFNHIMASLVDAARDDWFKKVTHQHALAIPSSLLATANNANNQMSATWSCTFMPGQGTIFYVGNSRTTAFRIAVGSQLFEEVSSTQLDEISFPNGVTGRVLDMSSSLNATRLGVMTSALMYASNDGGVTFVDRSGNLPGAIVFNSLKELTHSPISAEFHLRAGFSNTDEVQIYSSNNFINWNVRNFTGLSQGSRSHAGTKLGADSGGNVFVAGNPADLATVAVSFDTSATLATFYQMPPGFQQDNNIALCGTNRPYCVTASLIDGADEIVIHTITSNGLFEQQETIEMPANTTLASSAPVLIDAGSVIYLLQRTADQFASMLIWASPDGGLTWEGPAQGTGNAGNYCAASGRLFCNAHNGPEDEELNALTGSIGA